MDMEVPKTNSADWSQEAYSPCPRPELVSVLTPKLVSESDPQKEGLGYRLERKCTLRLECRCASDWFMIVCQRVFIGNTNCKLLVQFKETENK